MINVEAPRMIIVSMFRKMKLVSTSNDGLKSRRGKFQVPKSKIFGKKIEIWQFVVNFQWLILDPSQKAEVKVRNIAISVGSACVPRYRPYNDFQIY